MYLDRNCKEPDMVTQIPCPITPDMVRHPPLLQHDVIGLVNDITILQKHVLAKLRNAKELALDCEGVDLCRKGPISVVSIAIPDLCVLFDVLESQRADGVVDLLKNLLESPQTTKVKDKQIGMQKRKLCACQPWSIQTAIL
eukprot:351337-Chlamydomonas_euryale.AAC.1